EVVSVEAFGGPPVYPFDLGMKQLRLDRAGNSARDPILKLENIVERAVEAVRPDMSSGYRLDQLPADAHTIASLPDRAHEDVADAELAADLLRIDGLPLVGEART